MILVFWYVFLSIKKLIFIIYLNDKMELSFDCFLLIMSKVDRPSLEVFKLVSVGLNMISNSLKSKEEIKSPYDIYVTSVSRFKLGYFGIEQRDFDGINEAYMSRKIIAAGNLDVLKYFHQWLIAESGKSYLDDFSCSNAAFYGKFDILKYLHEHGFPWDCNSTEYAANGGHLEMVKYLIENGCPMYDKICDSAAFGGNIELMEYLLNSGCRWDEETCAGAAFGNSLEMLKYLHDNGCSWDLRI
jgi:hypothetical protein